MNHKERIRAALNHKPGPVPIDFGAFPTTGIHISIVEKLREFYGLEKHPVKAIEPYQMLGEIEDDLKDALGVSTKPVWGQWTMYGFKNEDFRPWKTPWGQEILVARDFVTTEKNGEISIYAGGDTNYPPAAILPDGGYFFDSTIRQKPIIESELDPADNLEEFGLISAEDLEYYKRTAEQLDADDRFIVGNLGGTAIGDIACVPGPMLKDPKGIRDVTEWYMSTAIRQDYIHEVFEAQTNTAIANLEKIHAVLGDTISVAYMCGNDFGTQNGPFCSNKTFQTLYMPYYKKMNNWVHANTEWKTFKHSCGAIMPLIPELIESGFDILNPVQWTATGMDMTQLKDKFGADIVFWGGGVDTQQTLPFGTPEDVRRQVLKTCENFSGNGGFVFNTIHNVQAKTPVENFVAMIDAVKEFNGE